MSRESLVSILGLIVLLVTSSGFPDNWIIYILRTVGVLIIILGLLLRRSAYYRKIDHGNGERGTDAFIESHHQSETEIIKTEKPEL